MAWREVSTGEAPVLGGRYRWTAWVRLPYSSAPAVRAAVAGAIRAGAVAGAFRYESVESFAPMASSSGAISDRWRLEARWVSLVGPSRLGGEPPAEAGVAKVVALVVGALLAGFGAVYVLSKLEREVLAPVADDVKKILDPILNPGTLVLAAVGIFLVARARR